jgi:hypothetical protein
VEWNESWQTLCCTDLYQVAKICFTHSVAVFNEGGSKECGFAVGTLLVQEVPSHREFTMLKFIDGCCSQWEYPVAFQSV